MPEAAKSLGLKVLITEDYLEAGALQEKAAKCLGQAKAAMMTRKNEATPDFHAKHIVEHFLDYKRLQESARQKFKAYRSSLNPSTDERLNREQAVRAMDTLLQECLQETDHNLRDALGCFFNRCMGEKKRSPHITPANVLFVNEIFRLFVAKAPKKALHDVDLDRYHEPTNPKDTGHWKALLKREGFPFSSELERTMDKYGARGLRIDPLLFAALLKRESRFDPHAVSRVGAAGLTQIMPQTALTLGMKKIYSPAYFDEAMSLVKEERRQRQLATTALFKIDEKMAISHAREARTLMQCSLRLGKKKEKLFLRYKVDLLKNKTDDRLVPARAIDNGYKYFGRLMKMQEGDISLALASYNAGPHRVSQYKGIPPFRETVFFRNEVVRYYHEYLEKMKLTRQ